MDQSDERELYRRISQLENDISEIKDVLNQLAPKHAELAQPHDLPQNPEPAPATPPPPPLEQPDKPRPVPPMQKPPSVSPKWEIPEHMRTGEFWLKIIGIGLTLFGVAFAFKYSIEQGWINPLVRHLFGLAIGTTLLVFGLRLYTKRPGFAQVLLGGSIGTFYITCFSAFQLFELISHPVAFGGMIVISVASFWIAIRQNEVIFSLIGTAGALGTPFLLYTGAGNLPGLVLYTCLVLVSTTAVYFFKGWRLLLWLSVIGGWIVLGVGINGGRLNVSGGADSDRWAMQAGLIVTWLIFWLAPVGRRIARVKASARWKTGLLGIGDDSLADTTKKFLDRHVHLMAIGPVLIALMLSIETWPDVQQEIFGWGAMGATLLYAMAAFYLKRTESLRNLAFTHAAVGTMLFTVALCLLLEGETLLFVIATEAVTLHLVARRLSDKRIARGGHFLLLLVGLAVILRVGFDSAETPAFFNNQALVDLWVIACGVATAFIGGKLISRRVYLIAAAIVLGLLFNREFSGDLLFFLLTVETAGFYLLARKLKDDSLDAFSHITWGCLAVYLATRLCLARTADIAFVNIEAAINLLPILAAIGASFWLTNASEKRVYYFVVHLGFLAWLAHELLPLENGQGFVSVAWGVYGALLLIAGLRRNLHLLRMVGLGTLMLVVAKLFIVDLARLETIWRVLLFVGFGGVFLALSYYFPKLWKKPEAAEDITCE